jgi:hypothetical protein
MTLEPSGGGQIRVTRSVVDGRGRTNPASVSIEEAKLVVRPPENIDPRRVEFIVEVRDAVRRYPDDPKDRWPLDGLVVKLVATNADQNLLNVHFDLPDGRGSFGETLFRRAATAGRRGARPAGGATPSPRRGR